MEYCRNGATEENNNTYINVGTGTHNALIVSLNMQTLLEKTLHQNFTLSTVRTFEKSQVKSSLKYIFRERERHFAVHFAKLIVAACYSNFLFPIQKKKKGERRKFIFCVELENILNFWFIDILIIVVKKKTKSFISERIFFSIYKCTIFLFSTWKFVAFITSQL